MGSILTRRRKNGSLGYTAIIRLKRDVKTVISESAIFDRRQLANEWMRRREAELDQQRARGEPQGKSATLAVLLERHGKDTKELTPWVRTKEADLKRLAGYEIAKKNILRLTTLPRKRQPQGPRRADSRDREGIERRSRCRSHT